MTEKAKTHAGNKTEALETKQQNVKEQMKNSLVIVKMSSGKTKLAKEMKMLGPIKGKHRTIKETKMKNLGCNDVRRMVGSEWDFHQVAASGKSGGILVLWKHRIASFMVIVTSKQCIIGELITPKGKIVKVCIVYGNKNLYERRKLWEMIEDHFNCEVPCLVGGDFNCLVNNSEKIGGKSFVFSQGPQEMKEFMTNNDYHDIGLYGPNYTWCNNKDGLARIWESLKIKQGITTKNSSLRIYGARNFGVQNREAAAGGLSQGDLLLLRSKVVEFNANLARIATWWRQRSKCQWMDEGEKNTRYYHTYASAKKKRNQILQIAREDGSLVSNHEDIHNIMENFFKKKWCKRSCNLKNWPNFKNSDCIQVNMRKILEAGFTIEELKLTLKNMGNNKSPGADGANAYFFKNYWSIVERATWNAVNNFFKIGEMLEQWKETVVVLILKIQNAKECSKFRPICLCQTIYKMVTSMILNRFKNCLLGVISDFQGTFVSGRSILDNCLIA
ncbi:uncharacterized protein LOC110111291 [Dendrobium catenatum]|uniref:uncharacterized protein LOC110111291 n=1 Tax=Dendrobium catenatum TaxID=906689 RepID=UPI0009F47293|nr:uncharacterized protein LOC110111291 [Dendrobium catenatum]